MSQPAEFNTTTLIVDDMSNLITYSAGWTQGFSGSDVASDATEYMSTKHGSSNAGNTAKFSFTGTSVAVYGSLGSFDVYGVPVSSYSVDGGNTATYTAPIIEPPGFAVRQLFYQSPTLATGTHELVITNVNGTSPSVLWIDYILYDPSETTGETGGGGSTIAGGSSSSPTSSSTSSSLSSSTSTSTSSTESTTSNTITTSSGSSSTTSSGGSTSSSTALTSPSAADAATTSAASKNSTSKSSPIGAIVGGVVGGLALILLSALLFLCYRRRRCETDSEENSSTTPFRYKDPEQNIIASPFADPEERSRANVLPVKQIASIGAVSARSQPSLSGNPSTPRESAAPVSMSLTPEPSATESSRPLSPPIFRHTDSGLRLPTPVEVPPEYTQD